MLQPASAVVLALLLCGQVGGYQIARIRTSGELGGSASFRSISVPFESISVPHENASTLPANRALGSLLAYVPSPGLSVTDDLLVFLAGSGQPCEVYSQFLETMGGSIRTVCLPYDNIQAIGVYCVGRPRCYPDLRLTAFNGSFGGVSGNNIESRLASALRYLHDHDGDAWKGYVDASSGLPAWSRVRLAGHSQGAGNAVLIGYYRELARVVQFSGVCDRSDWTTSLGAPATPPSRFFGMASAWDTMLCPTFLVQASHWRAEGLEQRDWWPVSLSMKANLSATDLGGSHTVISSVPIPDCDMRKFNTDCDMKAHDSTALNWDGMRSPYADGIWQSLCGV